MTDKHLVRSRFLLAAAITYAAYSAWLIGRMFWFLFYSMTSAVRDDELVMMHELRLFHEGKYGISYLWQPYWGHRMLIPRLLMMADERFFHFSNTPMVIVNVAAQCVTTALLVWLEWRILRDARRWMTIAAVSATAQLALSSLQLETFLFGMSQYTIPLVGAFSAIVLFALAVREGKISRGLAWASFACALLCAFSQGTSVFLGPVLVLVAFALRARWRVLVLLILLSAAFGVAYSVGYSNPANGMGVKRALLHPAEAIRIAALVLGGPITNQNLAWGAACGVLGMLLAVPPVIRFLRGTVTQEIAALTGISIFLILNEVGMAIGRYSPESVAALGSNTMLPSRYFTASFLFFGTLPALLLSYRSGVLAKASCVLAACVVGYLTLHTVPPQLDASVAWLEFHRTLDVAGAGMIIDATDPRFLFRLTPDQKILDYYRTYLQPNRLSYFADERASWIGRDLKSVFGNSADACGGRIDSRTPAGKVVRLEGYVDGQGVRFPLERQIVLTDRAGTIDGIGNTLVVSEKRGGQDFVAYGGSAAVDAYVITPDGKACKFD